MSHLNMALQCSSLCRVAMAPEFERLVSNANSMSAVREVAAKHDGLKVGERPSDCTRVLASG